jgi:hypothetical protein
MEQLRAEMRELFTQLQEQLLQDRQRAQSPEAGRGRSSSHEEQDATHDLDWED